MDPLRHIRRRLAERHRRAVNFALQAAGLAALAVALWWRSGLWAASGAILLGAGCWDLNLPEPDPGRWWVRLHRAWLGWLDAPRTPQRRREAWVLGAGAAAAVAVLALRSLPGLLLLMAAAALGAVWRTDTAAGIYGPDEDEAPDAGPAPDEGPDATPDTTPDAEETEAEGSEAMNTTEGADQETRGPGEPRP